MCYEGVKCKKTNKMKQVKELDECNDDDECMYKVQQWRTMYHNA